MKSRALLAAIIGAVAVALVAVVVWLLRGGMSADGQTVRVSVRHAALPEKNEKDVALVLEKQLAAVPRLISQRIEVTRLGVTADCTFEPANKKEREQNLAAVTNAYTDRPATVSDAPLDTPAIWIFSPKDLTKELRAVGNASVETCGEPQPNRVRVAVDTDKLKARLDGDIVAVELAVGADSLRRLTRWEDVDPEEVANRIVEGNVRVSDIATVTREPLPNRCNAYLSDGKTSIAHVVNPLPGLTPDARAKIDAIAHEAQAAIVHESDGIEVRFTNDTNSSFESRRRVAADYAVRGKLASGLDVVGSRISFDGAGSLVVRKPASIDTLKGLIQATYGVAWGGVRGAHRLEVTVEGDDRKALDKRAKEVQQRVSTMDGVGTPLTRTNEAISNLVYDVDEKAAEAAKISVPALQLIASTMQGDGQMDAAVFVEPRPLGKLFVHGAPLSAYVHARQRPVTVRLFRTDQKPSVELAFETDDLGVATRVRQALGESPDVLVRVLPPF